ncbi:unnamed protein product [Caenorhabditis angaria]|uniref:Uncharacterized protein n=1 Tax=Caenorhabditis angaria TaxID=860376 RepID=A0A9P1I7I4_9PELO|nr:unnamed protein product [Caenorhabditis angaria]
MSGRHLLGSEDVRIINQAVSYNNPRILSNPRILLNPRITITTYLLSAPNHRYHTQRPTHAPPSSNRI